MYRGYSENETPRSEWNPEIYEAQERLIRRYAPDQTFADIACLWGVDGACAFLAEEAGATAVTAMDKWAPTERFLSEHSNRNSSVRFVQADLHSESCLDDVGTHDVIWCSGLLYHTPNPVHAIGQLLSMARRTLVLGSKTLPSVPGLPGLAVYYPGLEPLQRAVYEPIAPSVARDPYVREHYFANWFWGLTPDALIAIVRSVQDVTVLEEVHLPYGRRHDSFYVVFETCS